MEELDPTVVRRIAAFEASGQWATPPEVPQTRGRRVWPIVLGPALAFAIVGSAVGAVLVTDLVLPHASVEDPGQPLAGAQLECMSPLEARHFLEGRGFADVVWQVERDTGQTVDSGSTLSDVGYVIPGSILSDGRLHMIVDARTGATPVGACSGKIR